MPGRLTIQTRSLSMRTSMATFTSKGKLTTWVPWAEPPHSCGPSMPSARWLATVSSPTGIRMPSFTAAKRSLTWPRPAVGLRARQTPSMIWAWPPDGPRARWANSPSHTIRNSDALAINNSNQVVGFSQVGTDDRAFLWVTNVLYDLNLLVPTNSNWSITRGYAINDAGQIVGTGRFGTVDRAEHAVLLNPLPGEGQSNQPPAVT